MDLLKEFNIHDLFALINKSDDDFMQWLRDAKLMWSTRHCECGKEMSLVQNRIVNKETNEVKQKQWPLWRCTSRKNHEGKLNCKGFFDGTFFSGAHLTPKQIIEFTYYWARKTHSTDEYIHDMKLGRQTIVDWKMFCRDVTVTYFQSNPQKIGANGATVEIDETVLCRPKYRGKGLAADKQWFFGGVERGSGRAFMVPVEQRNAATLLPILQQYVYAGAVIVSDCWAAYGGIKNLPEGYRHYTVNHSVEFVNKESGQHTNTIESTWQKFKQSHKERYGTDRGLLNSYVEEFLWRKQFDGPDVFHHFWTQVAEIYKIDS